MSRNKKIAFFVFILLLTILPLLILAIKQSTQTRSNAAAADKLEAESGVLTGNILNQTDPQASGGNFIRIGANISPSSIPAFPGAEGGGASATGGRGGTVIKVTNLNDSGPGSLRACAEATGARTCVFTVGGVINLLKDIIIINPNLTIAGQTAPGGIAVYLGIAKPNLITFQEPLIFRVEASNVIIRYMRLWGESLPNPTAPQPRGSIGISIYKPNVIVDHNDITWFTQEGINVNAGGPSGGANISIQWNIIGENIYNTTNYPNGQSTPILMVSDYSHSGKGGDPYGVTDMDIHHNLITTASHRMPNMSCQTCRIINNAIYNFGRGSIIGVDPSISGIKTSADYIGNHYKPGPWGPREWKGIREIMANQGSITSNNPTPTFSIFISGNRSEFTGFDNTFGDRGTISPSDSDSIQWNKIIAGTATFQGSATSGYIPLPDSYKRNPWTRLPTPASGFNITVDSAVNLPSILTSQTGVGAGRYVNCNGTWVNNRDNAQTRIINNYLSGTGPSSAVTTANAGNTLPSLGEVPACTDSDNDGMPDSWENTKGLNPNNSSDGNNISPNGYTQLENYINGI